MYFDFRNPLPLHHENSYKALIKEYHELEVEFMAAPGYYEQKDSIKIRSIAMPDIEKYMSDSEIDWIATFLAITYFDRFLSRNSNIPVVKIGEGFESNLKLFVFCCVSIASKLCWSNFSFPDFLGKYQVGSAGEVLVMELHILEGLQWRIRPLTAITFAYFLLPLAKPPDKPEWSLLAPLSGIIFEIQRDIRFTKYRPSTIAASAILAASNNLVPELHPETLGKVLKCGFIQQRDVVECFDKMKENAIVDFVLNPDKSPLDQLKQRFKRPGWSRKQKGLMIHEPAQTEDEIVEAGSEEDDEKQEAEVEIDLEALDRRNRNLMARNRSLIVSNPNLAVPNPNLAEPVQERRNNNTFQRILFAVQERRYNNTFERILFTCFLPVVLRCFGVDLERDPS